MKKSCENCVYFAKPTFENKQNISLRIPYGDEVLVDFREAIRQIKGICLYHAIIELIANDLGDGESFGITMVMEPPIIFDTSVASSCLEYKMVAESQFEQETEKSILN